MTEIEWLVKAREILHPGSTQKFPDGYKVIVKLPPGLVRSKLLCKSCGFQCETTKKVARIMRNHRKVCPGAVFESRAIFRDPAPDARSRPAILRNKKSESKKARSKRSNILNCPEFYPDDN